MTAHLLQLAIGPVQEFISAARRTRDLWFGSYLLAEISKAAALSVKTQGGKLVFPANDADLSPGNEDVSIANVIVAELPTGAPKTIATNARLAAVGRWRAFAASVFNEYPGIEHVIRRNVWNQQVEDVLEFYAAWVPLTPTTYADARKRLARLLAGRKNCRDFCRAEGIDGVPKSSLDGLRETVFSDSDRKNWPHNIRRRLRVRPGEQLDVVGLVKRTAEGHRPYPSVSRIAADPWLRGVAVDGGAVLTRLRDACESLGDLLHPIKTKRLHETYKQFPFEGTALYRTRHHEMVEEIDETEGCLAGLRAALGEVEAFARDAGLGSEPDPYLAVLVGDGDKMGEAISKLIDPEHHRTFSRELAKFATEAEVVVCQHHGVLIYSGGDDVLAFVPLDQALNCARELYKAFAATMKLALAGIDVKQPTLSVGLAIAHFNENLEDLLDYGRKAEKASKQPDRDGLAVHLHKRGGAPVKVRKQWALNLDEDLAKYAGWFLDGAVSSRTPYELHRLADLYDDWPDPEQLKTAIQADAVRVIKKKRPGGEASQMDVIRAAVHERVTDADKLRELASELLVARQLAVAQRQSGSPEGVKS